MLTIINYADGMPYENFRRWSSFTAKHIGKADRIIKYSSKDVPQSYKNFHKDIFSYKQGAGLWLWKPYLIDKTLREMAEGEWLFYVDSATVFIRPVSHLIRCAQENNTDVMLYELPLLDRQFTKKECYDALGLTNYSQNQTLATFLLLKNTAKTRVFVQEWLGLCEQEPLLAPKNFYGGGEFPDFFAHREDQSLLSLLRMKHGLPVFRDCSDYGETPHMYFSKAYAYVPKTYPNSDYPTILLSNRRSKPFPYLCRYFAKVLLRKMGFIKPEYILKKRRKAQD